MKGRGGEPEVSIGLDRLEVFLERGPDDRRAVGRLAWRGQRCFFEYDADFLNRPLWLSPFKLPPGPGLHEHRDFEFGPLFGLFDDSLPDGWGLLLMDRYFRERGVGPAELTPLDRLAWLGRRTMGALTYHPPRPPAAAGPPSLDLAEIAQAAADLQDGSTAEVLPALVRAGGSPGGARPKVLVGLRGEEMLAGDGDLLADFEPWIVKLPARSEQADAGVVELAYAQLARAAGIEMPETRLFDAGRHHPPCFGVRRFDRHQDRRFHVHSFGNLIHANFRIPGCDYSQLLEVTRILTRRPGDVAEAFRRMAFNVAMNNRDDHAKNFAFLLTDQNEWRLAPAFDLTFGEGPGGEHTMTLAGEGKKPSRRHLLALAGQAALPAQEADRILDQVREAAQDWPATARSLEIAPAMVGEISARIAENLERWTE